MGFTEFTDNDWERNLNRVLLIGPPDSGKTRSARTWPHDEQNLLFHISYPGEKGTNTLVREHGIKSFVYKITPESKQSSRMVVNEVRQLTVDILSGKHGKCHVFFGDGLHKLCEYYLDVASDGAYFKGTEFEPKLYTKCYGMFLDYINLIMQSDVPYVVFTLWDGREPDSYKGVESKGGRIYPELPGKLAKRMVGEFSIRLYSKLEESSIPGKPPKATWVLKQDGQLGAVGLKLPEELQAKLPKEVEQDWVKFEALLRGLREAA